MGELGGWIRGMKGLEGRLSRGVGLGERGEGYRFGSRVVRRLLMILGTLVGIKVAEELKPSSLASCMLAVSHEYSYIRYTESI
jgi:hypothetical protein